MSTTFVPTAADSEATGYERGYDQGCRDGRAQVHEETTKASGAPTWSAVDDATADLLTLVAEQRPATPSEVNEWDHFVWALRSVALTNYGLIDQNAVRPLLRGEIKPQRIGAFYNRAAKAGLIRASSDHTTSNDKHGRNTGKPTRVWRWLGT